MAGRFFLALTLPRPAVAALERADTAFLASAPTWAGEKWVRADLLHVTLEFLGPVDESEVEDLVARLRGAATGLGAFDVALDDVVAVPSRRHATMLWATVLDVEGAISGLRDRLLNAIPAPECPQRPYRPHVTLVRARRPRPAPPIALEAAARSMADVGKKADGIVSVHSVTLFSSTLTASGPEYREIAVIALTR